MFESGAYAETGPPADLFVFDDQTHIVRTSMNGPNALSALAQGPGSASAAAGFTANPFNGGPGTRPASTNSATRGPPGTRASCSPTRPPIPGHANLEDGEFHMDKYIRRFFLESQVSVSIISNANIASRPCPRPSRAAPGAEHQREPAERDPDRLAVGSDPGLRQSDRRVTAHARTCADLSGNRQPPGPVLRRLHAVADRQLPPRLVEGLQHRGGGQGRHQPQAVS